MNKNLTWAIGGEAGFGIMSVGLLFSKLAVRSGFHIFTYAEYPSLIRGGHNVIFVHFSHDEVFSQKRGIDLLVALNRQTFDFHKNDLEEGAEVIFDEGDFLIEEAEVAAKKVKRLSIPLKKIISNLGTAPVMINNLALGASVAIFGFDLSILLSLINDQFADKGQSVVEENQKAARAGYDYVIGQNWTGRKIVVQQSTTNDQTRFNLGQRLVITGNEAVALGALVSGCQFYAAYPMTPSTSILHFLAEKGPSYGMVVRQPEDEIGVINEAVGASFAGVRAMVGTSGGGFALMNEAVALTGMTETPLVIVVSQRPGPATGMPTWTEQGDLQFIMRSGHGEFSKIVLAPGDPQEAYALTKKAFNLADIYQCPVFIILDKYLSESHKSFENSQFGVHPRGVHSPVKLQSDNRVIEPFPRYKVTADGISPRILPGTKGYFYQANSYEHLEDGYTTESAQERKKQVEKRMKKIETYLANHAQGPTLYGPESADITFVGWGSIKMPMLQALTEFRIKNLEFRINFLHFSHIWPLAKEKVAEQLKKAKRLVLIENNFTGQFGQLLRQETGVEIKDRLLKYDGRPFYPEEIIEYIAKNTSEAPR